MLKSTSNLSGRNIIFFGDTDKEFFFERLKRIDCVDCFDWKFDQVIIYLKSNIISEDDLHAFICLFKRFDIDMRQLRPFLTEENKKIFMIRKKSYYYEALFGQG